MELKAQDMLSGLPLVTALSFFIQMLSTTIVNTALPSMAVSMRSSPFAMHLAVVSYALTVALLIPVSGWVADRYGTRRAFLWSVGIFVAGSLCCACSATLAQLTCSRVIQGVGGAMMVPVSRLTLLRAYSRDEFVQVFTFVTIPGLIGPVLGPVLGGWIVAHASWPWIFLINVPLGIAGLAFAWKRFPDFREPRGRFDGRGFCIISAALLCMTAGLECFGSAASSWLGMAILCAGFACVPGYALYARRLDDPLIRLGVFSVRTFSVGIRGNAVARLGIGSIPFLAPMLLQVGLGFSPDASGDLLMASALGSLLTKTVVLRVLRRMGYRRTLLFLTLSIAFMLAALSLMEASWTAWGMAAFLFALGMLMSGQFTSMNTITLGDLDEGNASDGNSLLSVAQNLSVSFGVAISTALMRVFSGMGWDALGALRGACISVGLLTAASALVFMRLRPGDGEHLIRSSGQGASVPGGRGAGKPGGGR